VHFHSPRRIRAAETTEMRLKFSFLRPQAIEAVAARALEICYVPLLHRSNYTKLKQQAPAVKERSVEPRDDRHESKVVCSRSHNFV
jgi:hypothetical protein